MRYAVIAFVVFTVSCSNNESKQQEDFGKMDSSQIQDKCHVCYEAWRQTPEFASRAAAGAAVDKEVNGSDPFSAEAMAHGARRLKELKERLYQQCPVCKIGDEIDAAAGQAVGQVCNWAGRTDPPLRCASGATCGPTTKPPLVPGGPNVAVCQADN